MLTKKIFLFVILCVLVPGHAWAHATPTRYEPESGVRLESAPREISIVFSERVEERASSILVFAPDGTSVHEGVARVDAEDSHRLRVSLRSMSRGSYTVSWQVVSADDGHFTKGAYAFGVGEAPAAGMERFEVSHSSAVPEAATLWVELLGQAILVAAIVMRAFPKAFAFVVPERLIRSVRFGALLVIAGVVAFVVFKAYQLADVRSTSFGDGLISFATTQAGMAAWGRALLALAAALFWRRAWIIAGLVVIGMVVLRSMISHAAASKVMPELSVAINALHLFFKDLWIGALVIAVEAVAPLRTPDAVKNFLRSFTRLTIVCLFVAGVTGVYIVWLHLKGFDNVLATAWGKAFVALSIFGGLLFAARLAGWYIVRMRPSLARALPSLFVFEMFVGVLVLFATALIIITTPPLGAPQQELARFESNGAQIRLISRLAEPGALFFEIESKEPVRNVVVTLTNAAYNIGPLVAPVEKRFDGGYVVSKDTISPAGNWRFDIIAQREGVYDATAAFESVWPPVAIGQDPLLRMLLALALIGIIAASLFLWWWTKSASHLPDAFAISDKDFWRALGAAVLCGVLVWTASITFLRHPFERACKQNGDMWHTMQPMREGVALADAAFEGCMTADGKNHFTDMRDYQFFRR